ncbi:Uncharacterised protein [Vibrio cholerae]|uniref:Uncharacterized protein n=1 Tax=Vibrio cholerae TaxID=666 RepID=A0A656AA32_VIBCL|nr:Uncharacterised protein [Vibrio cholerae]
MLRFALARKFHKGYLGSRMKGAPILPRTF